MTLELRVETAVGWLGAADPCPRPSWPGLGLAAGLLLLSYPEMGTELGQGLEEMVAGQGGLA